MIIYGHPAGDLVISEFGRLLKDHFGADSLIARLGGEEFAVLCSGYSDSEMLQSLSHLQTKTEQHQYCYGEPAVPRNRQYRHDEKEYGPNAGEHDAQS